MSHQKQAPRSQRGPRDFRSVPHQIPQMGHRRRYCRRCAHRSMGGRLLLSQESERTGTDEISLGEQYVQTGDWNKAIKGDGATFKGYEKIARNYAWTDAANLAHFYCGLGYFNLGDYKKSDCRNSKTSAEGRRHGVCQRLGGTGQCHMWPTNSWTRV